MAASIVVTESKKIAQTSTTVSTVQAYRRTESHLTSSLSGNPGSSNFLSPMSNFPRLTEGRSSYHGPTSYIPTPYRSAFNNAPTACYRSFNNNTKCSSMEPLPTEKKSKSLFSLFKSNDKEKGDKIDKKPKEKDKTKKDNEKKSKKEKEKEKGKEKDTKNSNKIVGATDARSVMPLSNLNNNSYNQQYFNLEDMDKQLKIKVVKGKEFLPAQEDKVPTYRTKSRYSRGKVLVINNVNFPNEKYRAGADVDQQNISKLFRGMGFTIKAHYNKNKRDMEKVITDYCKDSSLKNADINVTVIMSHGNEVGSKTYIETIDGQEIEIEWIVNQFSNYNCKYLADKPKIFIFQCCRGQKRDIIQTDATSFQAPRTNADMLLAYATVPGFVSHRNPKLGTWYIQAICKIFMEHAHDTDVENLLKIVDANLEKNYLSHRQTSSYENRGFKRCYLNPIP